MNHSRLSGSSIVCVLFALLAAPVACTGSATIVYSFGDDGGEGDDGGSSTHHDSGNGGSSSGGNSSSSGSGSGGSSSGNASSSGGEDGGTDDSSSNDTGVDMGMLNDPDGFGAARKACIDAINTLRAMQSLPPYTLIDDSSIDMCIDQQATNDESMNSPHYSFINMTYPACNGFNAQDECLGYGNQVGGPGGGPHGTGGSGIVGCLYDMWAEQYNSNCSGCVGCQQPGGNCPNCDFYGMNGPECGHYVNMSASYFTMAACGFATGSGTWATQNFQ